MPERYFFKFPTLSYSNTNCVNLSRRAVLEDSVLKNPSVYHRVTVTPGYRSDLLAEDYYGDSFYDWLIYLNNRVIDPYYGWYMDQFVFDDFIKKKYGSIESASKRIAYFQLNWPSDATEITPSFYENSLPGVLKKYYSPNFNQNDKIVSYTRKKQDVVTNTNKLLEFTFTFNSGNAFTKGEYVAIKTPSLANTVGSCEVVFSNSSILKVQHISGNSGAFIVTKQFNSSTDVNGSSETITILNNTFKNNDTVVYYTGTANTVLSGLSNNQTYYVVNSSSTGIKLASTRGGTPINITAGSNENGHFLRWGVSFVGETSNTVATAITQTTLYSNITDDEAVFWSPVYFYDVEYEKNEKTKNVKLVDKQYALTIAEEFRTKMRE